MKYRLLLQFLRFLVYIKRFFWWGGTRIYFIFARATWGALPLAARLHYKSLLVLKKMGIIKRHALGAGRNFLQIIGLLIALLIAWPHSVWYGRDSLFIPGQRTIAYALSGGSDEYELEEVRAEEEPTSEEGVSWRQGLLYSDTSHGRPRAALAPSLDFGSVIAGGTGVARPTILPGVTLGGFRNKLDYYAVEPGDSLSSIAADFGVSVATILWENNLTERSIIRPGDVLKILPATGVMHTVRRGDTIKKIATLYEGSAETIIKFNKLREDGTDLVVGERIMIPDGVKIEQRAIARLPRTSPTFARAATPPASREAPAASGYVWPSGARAITQYYGWSHHALDIAGPFGTPTYAARSGVVEVSQCGWNSGYGCYVIINHGNGVKTLYGHHSRLLVSPGERVETGQTIALMGNTGKVRGRTGIHVHFEVQVGGVRVNPLKYVR